MNKYWKLVIAIVVFVIGIVGVKGLYDRLSQDFEPNNQMVTNPTDSNPVAEHTVESIVGDVIEKETTKAQAETVLAMDFAMVNEAGESVTLSSFFGKPIVINFWASWCGPCKAELPDFYEAYKEYGDKVQFLMINMTDGVRETVDVAKKYMADEGYDFPLHFDTNQEAAYTYSVYSIPMTFFIDANGNIVAYAQSMIDSELILQGINMITQ